MKTITEVEIVDYNKPFKLSREYLICACHSLLSFQQKERQRLEAVKVICPKCGCEIVYGGSF